MQGEGERATIGSDDDSAWEVWSHSDRWLHPPSHTEHSPAHATHYCFTGDGCLEDLTTGAPLALLFRISEGKFFSAP
jgi:hypothetical protein